MKKKNNNKRKKDPEQNATSKLNARIKSGDEQKIPKGYKATVSKDGAIIMLSSTSDLDDKPKKSAAKKPASAKPKKAAATPKVPKKPAKKKTVKKSDKAAVKSTVKKLAAVKKAPMKSKPENLLKHSDKDEMSIGGEKPIILNAKGAKPKPAPKVLRRAARTGGYTVFDKMTGKTFATEKEAKDYAADLLKKTGIIVSVKPTDRQVSHTFKPEEDKKKK